MKAYYYLLFRICRFYIDKIKENSAVLFSVTAASTVIVYIGLFTIYLLLYYFDVVPMFPNNYYVIVSMFIIALINYFLFIKQKKFLDYGFKKDAKGGIFILFYLFVTTVSFITVANYNRAKIYEQQNLLPQTEQVKQKPSLEGKIRKWLKEF